jgi:hypothetical protein
MRTSIVLIALLAACAGPAFGAKVKGGGSCGATKYTCVGVDQKKCTYQMIGASCHESCQTLRGGCIK